MRLWIGAEPSRFHPKDIFIYFKTIESKMASTSYHSCQNCLSTRPDWSSNLPKKAPGTIDFVQCEGSRGVLQVLNPYDLIIDLLEGCGSYDGVRESTFYLFTSKHVHRQAPELHFNRVHTSQHLFRVCYVTQHTRR